MAENVVDRTVERCLREYEHILNYLASMEVREDGSPIETGLRLAFWHYALMSPDCLQVGSGDWRECSYPNPVERTPPARLFQQASVGNFRVDFAIILRASAEGRKLDRRFAIECDGFHFHDRTKAQIERDKARDRELVANGFSVLRFAGSEIYRDALLCARQTMETVDGVYRDWVGGQ